MFPVGHARFSTYLVEDGELPPALQRAPGLLVICFLSWMVAPTSTLAFLSHQGALGRCL